MSRAYTLIMVGLVVYLLESGTLFAAGEMNKCVTKCSKENCIPGDIPEYGMQQCYKSCAEECKRQLTKTGVLRPKFHILTVLYSPPGCTSSASYKCNSNGQVAYLSGSSTGTRHTVRESFKDGIDVSVGAKAKFAGVIDLGLDSSSSFSSSYTDSFSQTISKGESFEIRLPGNGDGVDHEQDQFILLLNPAITWSKFENKLSWNLGAYGNTAVIYTMYVSWLKNPSTMPPEVAAELKRRDFRDEDYKTILAQNPFANGSKTIDPERYRPTSWTLPYQPPASCKAGQCSCASFTTTLKNDFNEERSKEYQTQYSVGLKESAGTVAGDLRRSDSWTWTITRTITNSKGSSNAASTALTCPSTSYTGPTLIAVYWDTLYGSFLFVPVSSSEVSIIHSGRVTDASGRGTPYQQVTLTYGNREFNTLTNVEGEYKIGTLKTNHDVPTSGNGMLSIGATSVSVKLEGPQTTDVKLPQQSH